VGPLVNGGNPAPGTNPATYFYYDGWNLLKESGNPWTADRLYIHGGRVDEIVKSINYTAGGQVAYHHYDARGHCTMLTDSSGNILEQYEYDSFGLPYFYNGSGAQMDSSAYGNRFLFTGREWLSDLHLYDYRNRMYQPELGRFMQPDPKEFGAGDYNLYRYCHNDPINKSDPTGLADTFLKAEVQKRIKELGSNIPRWVTVGTLTANFRGTSWQSSAYSAAKMAATMAHNDGHEYLGIVVHQANSSTFYATPPTQSDLKGKFYGGHAQASALGDLRVLGYKTAAGYWSVAGHMDLGGGWPKHADGTTDEDILKAGHMNAVLANPGMKGSQHANGTTYKEHSGEPDRP
jgi:RHS repeat-associated protein